MKKQIKVSILVPCCNVEQYIGECLESIVNQTLKDIEIICINDGSKDNTLKIIKEYALKDYRISIIDKPNSGYGDSMNKGLEKARGEYIGIVESDDFIERKMFEVLYNSAKENNADIVKSNFWLYWTSGKENELHEYFKKEECGKVIKPSEYDNGSLFGRKPSIWSAIYKRSFLIDNKINFLATPGASFQDTSFTFKVYYKAERMMCIYDAFLHYRQDNINSSVNNADKKAYCICDEYKEIGKYIGEQKEKQSEIYFIYAAMFYDTCIWMYEKLGITKKYEFLCTISVWLKKMVDLLGVENINFGECWWKKRDIVRIANDPFEYHMWRNVERYEQGSEKLEYKNPETKMNNVLEVIKAQTEKNRKPYFSIIVPVFNSEKYIRTCLESVLFQTFEDFEVICINDGSTDHTLSILEEYKNIDERFIIINKNNSGPSESRNMGIEAALGKYILFLDSDDYYSEHTCEILKKEIEKYEKIDAVIFGTRLFPDVPKASQWHYDVLTTPDRYFEKVDGDTIFKTPYLKIFSWRCCFKKEFLLKNQIRFKSNLLYGEDCVFMFEATLKMEGISVISDKLYNYRHFRKESLMDKAFNDYVMYANAQIKILKSIVETAEHCTVPPSVNYLEFMCSFIYPAIDKCPDPERNEIITQFVKIVQEKELDKYVDVSSENCKGFYLYCLDIYNKTEYERRHRVKILLKRNVQKAFIAIKHCIARIVPPSRRVFYQHSSMIRNYIEEQQKQIQYMQQQIDEIKRQSNLIENTNWAVNELIKKYNDDLLYKFPLVLDEVENQIKSKKDEVTLEDE